MLSKPKLLFLLLVVMSEFGRLVAAWKDFVPVWDEVGIWGRARGSVMVPHISVTKHVTGIKLSLTNQGTIYAVTIIDSDLTEPTPLPRSSEQPCTQASASKISLSVGTDDRVTKIETWSNDVDTIWYRLKITFNYNKFVEYDGTPSNSLT